MRGGPWCLRWLDEHPLFRSREEAFFTFALVLPQPLTYSNVNELHKDMCRLFSLDLQRCNETYSEHDGTVGDSAEQERVLCHACSPSRGLHC